jgi:uncharacterized membrane protein (UPF0182 family)
MRQQMNENLKNFLDICVDQYKILDGQLCRYFVMESNVIFIRADDEIYVYKIPKDYDPENDINEYYDLLVKKFLSNENLEMPEFLDKFKIGDEL